MSDTEIERIYKEQLDKALISNLAKVRGISLEDAMSLYYSSKLANKIESGNYGIQYLDYRVLTDILQETELD